MKTLRLYTHTHTGNIKGITLIALVITIVVLIILAGVGINLSIGENGIFKRAKQAKNEYKTSANEEQVELADLEKQIDNLRGNAGEKSAITASVPESADIEVNAKNDSVKLPISTVVQKKGNNLSIENGGIKIGKGISSVLVSASSNVRNPASDTAYALEIYLNNIVKYDANSRSYGTSGYGISTSTYFLNVEEGDIIYLYADAGGKVKFQEYYLTVVEY